MMRRVLRLSLVLAMACFAAFSPALHAQTGTPQSIFLWPNGAPGALGDAEIDKPRMYIFLPKQRSTSTAILIIPGGGYQHVAIGHEGFQIAEWLNEQGMPAFVLDYRVKPYRYPVPIDDGRRAMRLLRAHAEEYGIDPNRIGVWGSSAGGHLASSLGTHCESVAATATNTSVSTSARIPVSDDPVDHLSCKPDFMVLAYPVIAMEQPSAHSGSRKNLFGPDPDPAVLHEYSNQYAVTSDTPPTFIFATTGDPVVPVENSLDFYRALVRAHVPVEMHLFDYSNHGCGLCGSIVPLRVWPALLRTWLIDKSLLPLNAPPLPAPAPNWPSWPKSFTGPGQF
jgi:acetyl esterase/lipase